MMTHECVSLARFLLWGWFNNLGHIQYFIFYETIAYIAKEKLNNLVDIASDLDRRRGRPKRPKRTLVSTWKKRLSTYTPSGPASPTARSASTHLQTDFERENHSKGVWKSISKFFAGPRSVSADRLAKPFTSNTVAGASKWISFLDHRHKKVDPKIDIKNYNKWYYSLCWWPSPYKGRPLNLFKKLSTSNDNIVGNGRIKV